MKRIALAVLLAVAPVLFAQSAYLVKDIHPGVNLTTVSPDILGAAGNRVYFEIVTGNDQHALWVSDGTAAGTVELTPLAEAAHSPVAIGDVLYFTVRHQLWRTDGTPAGTHPTTESIDEVDEPGAYEPLELAGRTLYFTQAGKGRLMQTDGTPAGTFAVHQEISQLPAPFRDAAAAWRGEVYFGSTELWKSDGTADGTVRVATLPADSAVWKFLPAGDRLFFLNNLDLWVTDGTQSGTRALGASVDIDRGGMALAGNRLLFAGREAAGATELWVSDGTVEGTHRLVDIWPGSGGSFVQDLTSAGDVVYFAATDPAAFGEVWVTDGTAAGTKRVADIHPGDVSSLPAQLTHAGDHLFFVATSPATGRELYAIALPTPLRVSIGDVRVAEAMTSVRFTVTLSAAATQTTNINYATSDGDATAPGDYAAATGTLTFAPGESSKTIDVPIFADSAFETNEHFFLTAGDATAFAIIEDDDATVDLALRLDFSELLGSTIRVYARNDGPAIATNIRRFIAETPVDANGNTCAQCEGLQIAPGAEVFVAEHRRLGTQSYFSVTVTPRENDAHPENNTIGWTFDSIMALDALYVVVGGEATLHIAPHQPGPVSLESSDPAVLSVPSSITESGVVRGLSAGRVTVRAFRGNATLRTLTIDVVAPGTTPRWPDGVRLHATGFVRLEQPFPVSILASAVAPLTGKTATGVVTITHKGKVVARDTLTAAEPRFDTELYATDIGRNAFTIHYEGDANFLPQTTSFDFFAAQGQVSMIASVTREGANATVRVRVTGSPLVAPTGNVRIEAAGIAFPPVVPILNGEAVAALTNVPESTRTAVITYIGDNHYEASSREISLIERRRALRH